MAAKIKKLSIGGGGYGT